LKNKIYDYRYFEEYPDEANLTNHDKAEQLPNDSIWKDLFVMLNKEKYICERYQDENYQLRKKRCK
jgi:hypothetical protein